MAMKISLSFKESEKSMYEHTMSQLSSSIYLKQLIKNDMGKQAKEEQINNNKHINLLDF